MALDLLLKIFNSYGVLKIQRFEHLGAVPSKSSGKQVLYLRCFVPLRLKSINKDMQHKSVPKKSG